MRFIICTVFVSAFFYFAQAQTQQRMVRFRVLANDSINLALNDEYNLIEDSCATIIRHAHFSAANHFFYGRFRDVSKANPSIIVSEGNYTADGLKDGEFESHYPNGVLQSKGVFKNNVFDGKWQINYPDGKPKIVFEADNGVISINDVWDIKGVKIINNGKGNYRVDEGLITWLGKLENGRPDGNWRSFRTGDPSQTMLSIELFKRGEFKRGKNSIQEYTDRSRIALIAADALPYVTAEKMSLSPIPCDGSVPQSKQHVVYAHYGEGAYAYNEEIKNVVGPYLGKIDLQPYNDQLILEGFVSEKGLIYNLQYTNAFNEEIARGLITVIRRLPGLVPATVNGVPVKQKISFIFNFHLGMYSFQYRFLPIN